MFSLLLAGSIPKELGALTELRSLGLDRNALTGVPRVCFRCASCAGPIPEAWRTLSKLRALYLGGNRLTGKRRALPVCLTLLINVDPLGSRSLLANGVSGISPCNTL